LYLLFSLKPQRSLIAYRSNFLDMGEKLLTSCDLRIANYEEFSKGCCASSNHSVARWLPFFLQLLFGKAKKSWRNK